MFRRFYQFIILLICSFSVLMISPAWSQETPNKVTVANIEPQALQILKQMTNYLKGLQQFSFQAEITEDILFDSGQKIQYGRNSTVEVRRPDRLRVQSDGDLGKQQLFYDGKTITLMNLSQNSYSTIDVPKDIDSALKSALQTYNLRVPLADVFYANAYESLTAGTISAFYMGLSNVQGKPCHHLAFRQKDIDWQLWIENSSTPVPRKLVITDKAETQGLQFTALLTNWNTSPQLEDSLFKFVAPANAKKVDLSPITR